MPVLQEIAEDISRATGVRDLSVEPFVASRSSVVMLMRGEGQAFFAKIFTDGGEAGPLANVRYNREKQLLARPSAVPAPKLVFAADTQRVLVTREVAGHGFKHFMDSGRTLEALGQMARWIAGFHASAQPVPMPGTLWDHFGQYADLRANRAFARLRPLLSGVALKEHVLTKGDCSAADFKFTDQGAVGLDFERAALRAAEYDMIALVRGLSAVTGESIPAMVETVVQQYSDVRKIDDEDATVEVVAAVVEALDA